MPCQEDRCLIGRAWPEKHIVKKIVTKKHLSPSRRRGLRRFFVQGVRVVQSVLQARPAGGLHGGVVIARCEKFCNGVQWSAMEAT